MKEIAKEIIEIKFKQEDTIQDCMDNFYQIMHKYNIKEGTATENGRTVANYDWTMCLQLFKDMLSSHIDIEILLGNVPEDLKQ